MADYYLWIKSFHIIAVLFWMAALFYLPRLFVYHGECAVGSKQWLLFCVMERRLACFIMTPSMIAAWLLGLLLASLPGLIDFTALWPYGKLAAIIALTWMHALLEQWRREFAAGRMPHSPRFFRLLNEVPPLLAVAVVILVIVRPL